MTYVQPAPHLEIIPTGAALGAEVRAGDLRSIDEATFKAVRDYYRAGIPKEPPAEDAKSAAAVYSVLAEVGGSELVGESKTLEPGTFWTGSLD